MSKVGTGRGAQPRVRSWRQWTEREGREALAAWRRSGLSAGAFCAREGCSRARLSYWSKRLGESRVEVASTVSFVPVSLSGGTPGGQIEIELGAVVVRVRQDADVEYVARLVGALAAAQSC